MEFMIVYLKTENSARKFCGGDNFVDMPSVFVI